MAKNNSYINLLTEFVSFKSISTDSAFLPEIAKTVAWLKTQFESHGFTTQILEAEGVNPVVYASLVIDPKKETVLVYGHYDVQPASEADGWASNPFTLTERSGRIYGRGAIDNKGQVAIHMATVFELASQNKLKYNVKFLIEGNEETANPQMGTIMRENKDLLASDHVMVSDGEIVGDTPTIDVSLRGGLNLTLKFKTAKNNLHSGIYGGAVPSAPYELIKFLGLIYDSNNSIAIPGYYDHVDPITPEQTNNNLALKDEARKLLVHAGIKQLLAEPNFDFFTQTGLRPTIQVTGFKSGYIDTGYSNIVPATAEAKINFRIVKSQSSKEVLAKFTEFAKAHIPSYVDYTIEHDGLHEPVKADISTPIFQLAKELLTQSFGKAPIYKNVGGAIPFVGEVQEIFGLDVLQVPLCNDDCNMHGVDENYDLTILERALTFSHAFFTI